MLLEVFGCGSIGRAAIHMSQSAVFSTKIQQIQGENSEAEQQQIKF